jgi:hypothetical protein
MEKNTDKTLDIDNNCMFGRNKSENHVNMVIDGVNLAPGFLSLMG